MSVTGLAGMLNLQKLTPELIAPSELFVGTPASFRIRLHNGKRILPSFLLKIDCPSAAAVLIPIIASGKDAEAAVGMVFQERGRASVTSVTVSSTFPVNFFTRYWTLPLDAQFVVFPRLLPGKLHGHSDDAEQTGENMHHHNGVDGELERIAAYSGREPLRMIHWKHAARNDELVVKEFGTLLTEPLIIDLEAMAGMKPEERISRAAWLVRQQVLLRPVGLKLGKGRTIPAETGYRHGLTLLTELALYDKD